MPQAERLDEAGPEDPAITARVLLAFQQCLFTDGVALDDDFFSLGGDSLAATRLLERVTIDAGPGLTLDALFKYPTPRLLARAIAARCSAAQPAASTWLPLNGGGTGAPIFFVHGAAGNPWPFRGLVDRAGFTRPVLGARAPDLDWESDVLSLPEMVAHYVTEIRRVQPRGPYSLVGYSLGGHLAFEIANRMVADGQTVDHLIMLDTPGPVPRLVRLRERGYLVDRLLRRAARDGHVGAWIFDRAGIRSPLRRAFSCFGTGPMTAGELCAVLRMTFPGRAAAAADLSVRELCALIVHSFREALPVAQWESLTRHGTSDPLALVKAQKVWAKNHWLTLEYTTAKVFPGTIALVASDRNESIARWERHSARPLLVQRISTGDNLRNAHAAFLKPQFVDRVASALKHLLDT